MIRLLLGKSLAEEENADSLLTQVARELVAQTRGISKAPKPVAVREDEHEEDEEDEEEQ